MRGAGGVCFRRGTANAPDDGKRRAILINLLTFHGFVAEWRDGFDSGFGKDGVMRKIAFWMAVPALLSACGNPIGGYPEGWQAQKAACAGGDYTVCSELGHQARDAEGGTTVVQPKPFSTPIVD